jgi:hypothetical protein
MIPLWNVQCRRLSLPPILSQMVPRRLSSRATGPPVLQATTHRPILLLWCQETKPLELLVTKRLLNLGV